MRRPLEKRLGGGRTLGSKPFGLVGPQPPYDPADEDPRSVLALLEAIGGGDSAEIFRRAVEKDMREVIVRSRRLRADLALTPEVARPIMAEALESVLSHFDPNGDGAPGAPPRGA